MTDQTTTPAPADDVAELAALIAAGGFWRLAPEWLPRYGYAKPTPDTLRAVEAGLRRLRA
jgi:hypothetical protein